MKNTTIAALLAVFFCFGLNAQTISFETSEEYTLGNINGQSNWETTDNEQGGNIENQIITNEIASEGENSFKIIKEPDFSGQPSPLVGGFYNYPTPISNTAATFSADIFINSLQDSNALTFLMGLVHNDAGELRYRTYFNFHHLGYVEVFVTGGPTGIMVANTGKTWQSDKWYNLKIETLGEVVKFYLDNEEVYVGTLVSDGPIDQVRFVHDNYDGVIYIDNFRTNDEPLSITEVQSQEIVHFYDQNTQTLLLKSEDKPFTAVSVFNILGQEVLNKKLSEKIESLPFHNLTDGIYIIKVNVGNQWRTLKVLKY